MIGAAFAYLPWLALDVLVEAAVAAAVAPRGETRRMARFAAAAALATHGLATTLRLVLPHDVMVAEVAWAAIDYALWRTIAQVPAGVALRLALWTNLAAAGMATALWIALAF